MAEEDKQERVGEEQEAESKEVEKLIQVNSRNYGQGTMGLRSGPPSSAACLLCGLGTFSVPSELQLPHLHSGEHQRRCG